ncbi:MAG: LysE family transporter [Bacteroidetes bacterium]|nr:LysE family transporter [Bacteroidota bacterium]
MNIDLFLEGALIGLLIAAPVGPIGVLCIKRSLAQGPISGLVTGLVAATADACYGAVAAFGLTFISTFVLQWQIVIQMLGIVFLVYLGVTTFREKPATEARGTISGRGLVLDYVGTVFLTLTNPTTIVSFIAIFAGIGITAAATYAGAGTLVLGVFLGSALWWIILSNGVGLLRARIDHRVLGWINKLSGAIILGFALVLTFRVLMQ